MNRLLSGASMCIVATTSVVAMGAAHLSTQVSARQVEIGQPFTLQLSCMVDAGGGQPSDPQLAVPRGVTAQRPSVSTQQNVSIINGQIQQQSGVTTTWVLVASSTGRLRVGPASIAVNGQRFSDRPVEVEVVAQGTLPRSNRARRRGMGFDPFDPFDPFGGSDPFSGPMFPPGANLLPTPTPNLDEVPAYPPDLNFEKARDPIAFLDARLTANRVVLGEQTTLRVYAYGKPGPFNLEANSEPSRDDFLSYQNERDNPLNSSYRIKVNGELWFARKILSYALFPTKTGSLPIGELEARFVGAGLLGGNVYRDVRRKSPLLQVIVEDPPIAGRPAGYHLGDVGNFTLTAKVEPRSIKSGESVSVQIEVSGTGQLPQRLEPPEQTAVDWLEPTVTQQIDTQRERMAGSRQFNYVVKIDGSGIVHLGTFRFPYFDPSSRKYSVAKAELGQVTVEAKPAQASNGPPNAAQSANGASSTGLDQDQLLAALQPRQRLGQTEAAMDYLAERRGFPYWLLAGPIGALGLFGLRGAVKWIGQWRKSLSGSARALVDAELKAARQALSNDRSLDVASNVERLVHVLIEQTLGVRSRGILRADLARELAQRGLDPTAAEELVSILERCDHLRFVRPSAEDARRLVADVESVASALLTRPQAQSGRSK